MAVCGMLWKEVIATKQTSFLRSVERFDVTSAQKLAGSRVSTFVGVVLNARSFGRSITL